MAVEDEEYGVAATWAPAGYPPGTRRAPAEGGSRVAGRGSHTRRRGLMNSPD
jgi:hypothetical protein